MREYIELVNHSLLAAFLGLGNKVLFIGRMSMCFSLYLIPAAERKETTGLS